MDKMKFPFYARLAFILVALISTLFLLWVAKDIFIPLVFGLLIAILLFPVNRFFEQKLRLGRGLSAMLCILLFIAVLVAFFYIVIDQIVAFSHDFASLKIRFEAIYADFRHWVSYKFNITRSQQTNYINTSTGSITDSIVNSLKNVLTSFTSILLLAVFVFIFSFFILFHRRLLMRFMLQLFSDVHRDKVKEVILETKTMINSYIVGLLIEMLIMGFVNCTLLLVLGVNYAILLGIVAAVLNIIPYLGIYTAILLTMLVTFAHTSLNLALEAGIGLLIIHFIDANILMPRIVGARVKMNPFITIIAVIIGEYLWGIPGMFLFIPIAGIIKLICERVEGLEAWGLLIGVDEVQKKPKSKILKKDLEPPKEE